jgi:DNA-binding response OmpR family regulator
MTKSNDANRIAARPASGSSNPAVRGKKRVLVVDDERDLVDMVAVNLQRAGYEVLTAYNGLDAVEVAKKEIPDLILLDLMLPGIDGNEITRRLKSDTRTDGVPIVMLSARGEETDIVVGLTLGADDYVTKPFSPKVLIARMAAVLRRKESSAASDGGILRAGPLEMHTAKHQAMIGNDTISLTFTEFKLLSALVQARGRVLTRDQLMNKAMGTDVFVTDRAIDVHITGIRKKLADHAWIIHTVRGVGYRVREDPDSE